MPWTEKGKCKENNARSEYMILDKNENEKYNLIERSRTESLFSSLRNGKERMPTKRERKKGPKMGEEEKRSRREKKRKCQWND